MAGVIARLQKIREETYIAQDLLEYAVEDANNLDCTSRTRTILDVLRDKLCEIDGLQQSLLNELMTSAKMPQQSGNSSKGQEKNNSIKL